MEGIDHELVRRVATWETRSDDDQTSEENVFTMVRRIGQAKATLAADYAAQLARSAGKVVFFAKHIDVMDAAEEFFAKRDIKYSNIRGDQTSTARQRSIDAFTNDPEVQVIVCSLTAAGVGVNLQVASDVVLAELSWTDAEQTQAIDRVHRIGQTEPVTAWRIIAAQTIDARIAELIDSKAGLAARALDGADTDVPDSADIQVEALVALLTDALEERQAASEDVSTRLPSGSRSMRDPKRRLALCSALLSHRASGSVAWRSRICRACSGTILSAVEATIGVEVDEVEQPQVGAEPLVAGDALVVVDQVATAVEHQPLAVDLDRTGVVRGMPVHDVHAAVDQPVGEEDLGARDGVPPVRAPVDGHDRDVSWFLRVSHALAEVLGIGR